MLENFWEFSEMLENWPIAKCKLRPRHTCTFLPLPPPRVLQPSAQNSKRRAIRSPAFIADRVNFRGLLERLETLRACSGARVLFRRGSPTNPCSLRRSSTLCLQICTDLKCGLKQIWRDKICWQNWLFVQIWRTRGAHNRIFTCTVYSYVNLLRFCT